MRDREKLFPIVTPAFLIKVLTLTFLSGCASIAMSLFIRYRLQLHKSFIIDVILGALILVSILFIQYIRDVWPASEIIHSVFRMRGDLLSHCDSASMEHLSRWDSGKLVTRIQGDIRNIQEHLGQSLWQSVFWCIASPLAIVYSFSVSWKLTVMSFTSFPLILVWMTLVSLLQKVLIQQRQERIEDVNSYTLNVLLNADAIKCYNQQINVRNQYQIYSSKIIHAAIREKKLAIVNGVLSMFGSYIPVCTVFFYGAYLVHQGEMTSLEWYSFLILMEYTNAIFSNFPELLKHIRELKVARMRIQEIFSLPQETTGSQKPISNGDILLQLDHVSYSYPQWDGQDERKSTILLKDISLSIRKGEKIAIVGASGCGKSTLLALLLREYLPDEGDISLYGTSISDVEPWEWRKWFASVEQKPYLFDMSLEDNIYWGSRDRKQEQDMVSAAHIAQLEKEIPKLECGYRTQLGQGGDRVSGGQRQRVAIARALYKKAPILCMDEATSALDEETQRSIVTELLEDEESTCIFVAHRLDAYKDVDRIVVIDDGRIIQVGAHASLIQNCPQYRILYQARQKEIAI